jgi:hypothetical protein
MRETDAGGEMSDILFNAETRRTRRKRGARPNRVLRAFSAFSASPRLIGILLLSSVSGHAAVTGVVINRTTGKPQAGATVALNKLATQTGIELIDQAKSDTQGRFTINQPVQGPHVIRTAYDGVTYNHMLPPGSPTENLTLEVYNSTKKQPADAKVTKHMILFEPAGGQMTVNETYLVSNTGNVAWNDADAGTVHFFLPAGANGDAKVQGTAPGSVPIGAGVLKTSKPDTFSIDFPVKPGDTRFDVTYTTSYTAGEPYAGKIYSKDENTYLIAPNGITLAGENLNDLGAEPRTQAHIFGLQGASYNIKLTGEEAAPPTAAAPADGGDAASDSGPQIEQIMPRVMNRAVPIIGIALGILALGFVILYRHGAPKESK